MIDEHPWIGLLVGAGAMAPFVVQVVLFWRNQRRERSWVRTRAVVLATRVLIGTDSSRTHVASYTYSDADGRNRSGRGEVDREFSNGEDLQILYDPDNPGSSQPHRRVGAGHWIAGLLGLLLFAVGVFAVAQGVHLLITGRMLE